MHEIYKDMTLWDWVFIVFLSVVYTAYTYYKKGRKNK